MNPQAPFKLVGGSLRLLRIATVAQFLSRPIYITAALLLIVGQALPQNIAWEKVSSPHTFRIDQLSVTSTADIFACYLDSGHFQMARSMENGNSWKTILAYSWPPISAALGPSDNLFALGWGVILQSSNKGDTWETWVDTLPISSIHTLRFSPSGYIFIGANSYNFRSKDNGKHWELIPLDYQAEEFLFLKNGNILAGVTSGYFPNPPQYIYRSTDSGNSWQKVLNADKTSGWSLATSNSGIVFAATAEYDSSLGGVYRSTDNGVSWSRVNNGLPVRKVNSLVITSTGKLFASIYGSGVFQSVDNGDTWTDFNNGLDNFQIQCLAMDSANHLYLGTGRRDSAVGVGAIYRFTLTTSVNEKSLPSPSGFALYQNYPNPFNSQTVIEYSIPSAGRVTITIHDLLGRQLFTLLNVYVQPGTHETVFDASSISSGIYYFITESAQATLSKQRNSL